MNIQNISIIFSWLPTIACFIGIVYGIFLVLPKAVLADPSLLLGYTVLTGSIIVVILWPLFFPSSGVDFTMFVQNPQVLDNISPISSLALVHLQETHPSSDFAVTSAELFIALKKSLMHVCGLPDIEAETVSCELVKIVVYLYKNCSFLFKC